MSDWRSRTRKVGTLAPAEPTLEQVQSWLAAEWSLQTEGPVPVAVYEERVARCQHKAIADDGREYCTKCGCGANERAKLDVKMHMPNLSCEYCGIVPASGEGREHLERIGGAASQSLAALKQAAGGLWNVITNTLGIAPQ